MASRHRCKHAHPGTEEQDERQTLEATGSEGRAQARHPRVLQYQESLYRSLIGLSWFDWLFRPW